MAEDCGGLVFVSELYILELFVILVLSMSCLGVGHSRSQLSVDYQTQESLHPGRATGMLLFHNDKDTGHRY